MARSVAESYYRALNTIGEVDAAESSLKDAIETEQSTLARYEHGTATLPNLLNARASREQADYQLETARGNAQTSMSELARSTGVDPTLTLKLAGFPAVPRIDSMEASAQTLIEKSLVQRPDLLAQAGRIKTADGEIKSARSALYPTVGLRADGSVQAIHTDTSLGATSGIRQGAWLGEVSLSWTIFDKSARRYRLIDAQARRDAEAQRLSALEDQATQEVWSSYISAKVAFRRLDAANAALNAAQTSFDAAKAQSSAGLQTFLDISSAQRALAQARTDTVQAQAQLFTELIELAYRTGNLLGSDLVKKH